MIPLALASVGLTGCRSDTEEVEVEIGYLGEARRNPFLAAQRLCEEYGLLAESGLTIAELPPHYTTVVLSSEAVRSAGTAKLVADWVAEGGTLLYLADGGSRFRSDFPDGVVVVPEEEEADDPDYLLDYMEVSTEVVAERDPARWFEGRESEVEIPDLEARGLHVLQFEGEEFEVEIPGALVFVADWEVSYDAVEPSRSPFLDFSYGAGDVYLIADAHPFRNRQIGQRDHAAFFWSVIESTGNDSVLIVVGGHLSFFRLLWTRGWMVLVPILLALAVWLWKSLPRHGPMQPDEDVSKRDFARHVDMLGHFLWRERAVEELLAPVRRRLRLRLRSLTSGEGGNPAQDRLLEALAERSGLSLERVDDALTAQAQREPARLVQIVRDLHTLSKSL